MVHRSKSVRSKSDPKENKRTGWPSHAFRDVSRYFSTIGFPIHVNLIAAVKSLRRRQYAGIKKSVRRVEERLSRGLIYPCDLERRMLRVGCLTNFTFSPSRPTAPTIWYAKQPSGQVPFKCLRNRRFCPSSDEHHCLSICLSVYRIDIREW